MFDTAPPCRRTPGLDLVRSRTACIRPAPPFRPYTRNTAKVWRGILVSEWINEERLDVFCSRWKNGFGRGDADWGREGLRGDSRVVASASERWRMKVK